MESLEFSDLSYCPLQSIWATQSSTWTADTDTTAVWDAAATTAASCKSVDNTYNLYCVSLISTFLHHLLPVQIVQSSKFAL